MAKPTGTRCFHCNRPIARHESVWAYHFNGGPAASWVGVECLYFIHGPELQGILDYAEKWGVPKTREMLERQFTTGVQAERSEP